MRKSAIRFAVFLLSCTWAFSVEAAEVTVIGLFKDRAVLTIDGQRRVLSPGQSSPEGVKLVSADSEGAVLEIEGKRSRYTLGTEIGATYAAPTGQTVRLWPDSSGMYFTSGSINGTPVDFLVDTGATTIAMNAAQARRLGLNYRLDGQQGAVETASGVAKVYKVQLDSVRVGEIQLRNVAAMVLEGDKPSRVLLGMSFLSRVAMEHDGQALVLRKKF